MAQNIPFQPFQQLQHRSNSLTTNGTSTRSPQMASNLDLSILSNIQPDQLALIAHLLHTGQMKAPPFDGGSTPQNALVPSPESTTLPTASSNSHVEQDQDVLDKEEGELDEREAGNTPSTRDFLRTPPKGPRKRSRSPLAGLATSQDVSRTSQQGAYPSLPRPVLATRKPSGLIASTSATQLNGGNETALQNSKDASIKAFIFELHNAGFAFDHVAKEVTDVASLRRLYQQLGVPMTLAEDKSKAPPAVNSPMPVQRKAPAAKRPVPAKPAAGQDRSAYLAKLQAAKNKKSEPAAATPLKAIEPEPPTMSKAPEPTRTVRTPRDLTSLAKVKLEALLAQRAAQQDALRQSSNDEILAHPTSTSPQIFANNSHAQPTADTTRNSSQIMHQTADLVQTSAGSQRDSSLTSRAPIHALPRTTTAPSTALPRAEPPLSASPTLSRGSGLPGLFTTLPGVTATANDGAESITPAPMSGTPINAQQRVYHPSPTQTPLAHVRPTSSLNRIQSSSTHLYSQTPRQQGLSERFVIADSDDEDSGDDMEISDHETPVDDVAKSLQAAGPNEMNDGRSTTSSGTPGGQKRKWEGMQVHEIKAMIAEMEQKQKRLKSRGELDAQLSAPNSGNATPVTVFSAHEAVPSATVARLNELEGNRRLTKLETSEGEQEPIAPQHVTLFPALKAQSVTQPGYAVESNGKSGLSQDTVVIHESEDAAQMLSSDEDEALYAESVPQDKPGAQAAPVTNIMSENIIPANASAAQSSETRHENSLASLPSQVALAGADHVETRDDINPPWSEDEEEEFYQDATSTLLTKSTERTQTALVSVNPSNEPRAEPPEGGEDEDEDDFDDMYEPGEPVEQSSFAIVQPPVAISSDDDDDDGGEGDEYNVTSNDDDHEMEDNGINDDDDDEESGISDDNSEDEMDLSDGSDSGADVEHVRNHAQPLDLEGASSHGYSPGKMADVPITGESAAYSTLAVTDDLAPELQPTKEELAVPPGEPRELQLFRPYESLLAKFKDFRYHYDFLNTVAGGFKSLTYCHKIDHDLPLCPWETAGGACFDKTCQYQHFRVMGLTDNDLLRSMGTEKVPAHTEDEDKRWKSGLNDIVQELRNTNQGKDVLAIARRIAEYRRQFRGDPTKTLLLD